MVPTLFQLSWRSCWLGGALPRTTSKGGWEAHRESLHSSEVGRVSDCFFFCRPLWILLIQMTIKPGSAVCFKIHRQNNNNNNNIAIAISRIWTNGEEWETWPLKCLAVGKPKGKDLYFSPGNALICAVVSDSLYRVSSSLPLRLEAGTELWVLSVGCWDTEQSGGALTHGLPSRTQERLLVGTPSLRGFD